MSGQRVSAAAADPSAAPVGVSRFPGAASPMRALFESHDWSASPLGPLENWPQSLRTTVGLMLPAMAQIVLFWGPDYVALYNDAYAPTIGDKHPGALGRPAREKWAELWDDLEPLLASVRETGETVHAKDRPFHINRFGYDETVWFDISYSAVPDESGSVGGVLCIVSETTERVLVEQSTRESEARFRAMANCAPAPIWVTNRAGIEFCNEALVEFFELPPDKLTGEEWMRLVHPDDLPRVLAARAEAWEHAAPYGYEARFRRADGSWRHVRADCAPRSDSNGTFLGYVGIAADLTEMKLAEAAMRESEERLKIALAAGRLGDWAWDAATDLVTLSDQAGRLFGVPGGPVMTWDKLQSLIEPGDARRAAKAVERAFADGADYDVEYRLRQPGAGWRWINAVGRPIFASGGAPAGMIGVVQDISERKYAEETLREDKRSLETLNRIGASLGPELDLKKVVQMVTDAGVELSGAQFGAFFYNVLNDAGESYMLYTIAGRRSAPNSPNSPCRATPRCSRRPSRAKAWSARTTSRKTRATDTTRREQGMPEGHLPVRSYLAVPVISRSGAVIGGLFFGHAEPGRFTERHEQLLVGIAGQAAIAMDNATLYEAAQREIVERTRAEEEVRELNQSLEARIAAAIAEREQAEEALRQSQKMEAVGQLTGGIAHDFNNLLTIITGNVGRRAAPCRRGCCAPRAAGARERPGGRRAGGCAHPAASRFLPPTAAQSKADRSEPAGQLACPSCCTARLGETIEVETVLAAGLWKIDADPNQLENAILNLAVNARDAMQSDESEAGGKLTIETANTHIDRDYAAQNAGALPGQYVAICVSDTGCGMDGATLTRAFEPFFTTKEVGKGTGLGLSMVYGFVKQSGGHLKIYSEEGQGTTVRIYLPRLLAEEEIEEERGEALVPEGTREETILVCEDDDDVRAYTVEVLRELGYRVLEAHDGASALRLLERQEGRVDLLFTDVVLPGGMTGAVVAQEARRLRPELRILFTTGYARNAIVHHGRLDPGVELLTKPFAYADLAARVRDMLDRA